MGRLRLDIVDDKMVRVLSIDEKVDNGAFGYISHIKDVDDLGRESYEFKAFEAEGAKGQIVFVADDGFRYKAPEMIEEVSLMRPANPKKPYNAVKNDGFDVVADPAMNGGVTRGYAIHQMDMISVEPHVLLGGEPVTTLEKVTLKAGDLLKPKASSHNLEKIGTTETLADAIAVVDGVELWCGYPVVVVRFL